MVASIADAVAALKDGLPECNEVVEVQSLLTKDSSATRIMSALRRDAKNDFQVLAALTSNDMLQLRARCIFCIGEPVRSSFTAMLDASHNQDTTLQYMVDRACFGYRDAVSDVIMKLADATAM